jgi:hypothetical protein
MGLFHRRAHTPPESLEPVPGVEVPEGMVAVREEDVFRLADQLATEASQLALKKPAPYYIDLNAKAALATFGRDRVQHLHAAVSLLAYNLFLLGYWCRVTELDGLEQSDVAPGVTHWFEVTHDEETSGMDWFGTLSALTYASEARATHGGSRVVGRRAGGGTRRGLS